jgi:hypothetical protein
MTFETTQKHRARAHTRLGISRHSPDFLKSTCNRDALYNYISSFLDSLLVIEQLGWRVKHIL